MTGQKYINLTWSQVVFQMLIMMRVKLNQGGRRGDVSNQRMPLWSICTQADAIYANIILPKIVPINFTPIAHQWGQAYSPTYGCMRIFGRENPYICVIGTISGYIWQYICGRPYAVSGSAYSASFCRVVRAYTPIFEKTHCSVIKYTAVHSSTVWISAMHCGKVL